MTGDDMGDLARAGALARSSKDREEHSSTRYGRSLRCSLRIAGRWSARRALGASPAQRDAPRDGRHWGCFPTTRRRSSWCAKCVPSAAVCGTPTLSAGRVIDELEDLDRGRYAGPVGLIDAAGDGEWCIGLRCAEISRDDPRKLRLFAGCGIVAASDPASEWEREAKLEPMRRALGLNSALRVRGRLAVAPCAERHGVDEVPYSPTAATPRTNRPKDPPRPHQQASRPPPPPQPRAAPAAALDAARAIDVAIE